MAQLNSWTTRELVKLGTDFASVGINNSHFTYRNLTKCITTPDQTEGSLLLSAQVENTSNDQGLVPDAAISPNLHSPILKKLQFIILSVAGQHSTRMRCCIHSQQNCFLDYFNDPVPDSAVTYTSDIPFLYSEREGMYTEVLDNQTGNAFLATSMDHEILLNNRDTVLYTFTESRRSSHNYIEDPTSSTTSHMPLPPSNPSDQLHPTYFDRKRHPCRIHKFN